MDIKFSSATSFYDDHLKALSRSPRSLEINYYALDKLRVFLSERIGMDDLPITLFDRFLLRSFFAYFMDKPISNATRQRIYDVINAIFNFLVDEELLPGNPLSKVEKPSREPHIITPLDSSEIQKLLDACPKTFTGVRNRLVVALLFDTGMRATELCSINLEDVDQTERTLLLRTTKGGKPRTAFYSGVVARLLSKYLLARECVAVCGKLIVTEDGAEIDRHWLATMLRRLGARAGVKVHPHLLRHSCGVAALKNGSDVTTVMRVLGHSNARMTLHYSQLADSDVATKHRQTSPADLLRLR